MKHHTALAPALGLCLAAFLLAGPALNAAEDKTIGPGPAPGLEIFDDAAPINRGAPDPRSPWPAGPAGTDADPAAGAAADAPAAPGGVSRTRREGIREDVFADPNLAPAPNQPPYAPPDLRRPIARPRPEGQGGQAAEPGYVDPYGDPFAGLDDGAARPPIEQFYGDDLPPDAFGGMPEDAYFPVDPVEELMGNLNIRNPYFPGMDRVVAARDVAAAGNIILGTLRQRRVVDATMARGVRGSVGAVSPYDVQRLVSVVSRNPQGPEDVLAPVHRVNAILDALEQPIIDAPDFASLMPQLLLRLGADVNAIRYAMPDYQYGDEGVYLELARTYIRAASTCDYFAFPRREITAEVKSIMSKSGTMFYPDGSSRGGDAGGITGNLFQIMLMMDYYSRDDAWFRRDIRSIWSTLERPGRFLLDIARPDGSTPMFGPRGSRELTVEEMAAIDAIVPKSPPTVQRIGLAASNSFPHASNAETYGGVYVSRDVKDPRGRYLAVRFGPLGDLVDVPSHNDFGSLEVMSRGARYLVDPGGYGGAAASAQAHGTLSLNGKYLDNASYNQPGTPADTVWRTNASIDFAADQAGFEDTKSWQRGVLYVKNLPGETRTDYWVVMDHVNLRDDPEPQDMLLRYQLAPGVSAYRDGPGVMLSGLGGGGGLRLFAVDAGASIEVTDGSFGPAGRGQVFDAVGGSMPSPAVVVGRRLSGDATTTTVLYPADDPSHRPLRIERDSDIIRGRTGLLMIDHGMGRVDVVAWAPPGSELVTPTLNLQLSADLAVFRIRRGKIARVDFVNLERFQAKEPDGGMWSMRVDGPAQSLTLEPEIGGGWQVLSDPANRGAASFYEVNLGPAITRRKFSIRPGEMRVIFR